VVNFTTVACRISSRLKQYKNCKNRLRLAKVIVKNKMSRFLWFTVYKNTNELTTDGQEKSCRKPYTDPNKVNTLYLIADIH